MITVGARVGIRPTTPQDIGVLDHIDRAADQRWGFRYHGAMPSPQQRRELMWEGVLAQRLIMSVPDGRPLGYATAYGADLRNGHAWLAVAAEPESMRRPEPLMGLALFITELFGEWPLRKLLAETATDNYQHFASVVQDGTATLDAHFPGALVRPDGTEADLHWLSIDADTWDERWGRLVKGRLRAARSAGLATGVHTT